MGLPPLPALDLLGPLAAMWRAVYEKAAQAAEARAGALLAEHVYRQHGRRAVAIVLDGAGAALAPGARCDLELPWAYVLEGWALYGEPAGVLALDVLVASDYLAYPSFASVCASNPPTLGDPAGDPADKNRDEELTDWLVQLPRGRVLRVAVASNAAVVRATLTLFLRAA